MGKKPLKVKLFIMHSAPHTKNEIVRKLTCPNPDVYEDFTENVIFEEDVEIPG